MLKIKSNYLRVAITTILIFYFNAECLCISTESNLVKCKQETEFCTSKITSFRLEQRDSIEYYLNKWENSCGLTEPLLRIKTILTIAAYDDSGFVSCFDRYLRVFYNTYTNRIYYSTPIVKMMRSWHEKEFGFVALGGSFDHWCESNSKSQLLHSDIGTAEYAALILFTGNQFEFDSLIARSKIQWLREAYQEGNLARSNSFGLYFESGIGIWSPTGAQQNYFAPSAAFRLGIGIHKNDFGLAVLYNTWTMSSLQQINYQEGNENLVINEIFGNSIGFYMSRIFYSKTVRWSVEPRIGLAVEYDIAKVSWALGPPPISRVQLFTYNFKFSAAIFRMLKSGLIGIEMGIQYSLLNESKGLITNFGSYSGQVGLVIKLM